MIAAILLAQWRSMRTFRTGGVSASTVLSWFSGLLFYGFWCAAAFGAYAYFKNPGNGDTFSAVLSLGLMVMLLYWQITPMITASMGGSLDLKKLLAYPIPHRKLFAVELMLRITTCLEMPVLLAGAVIGILFNPNVGGWLRAAPILFAAATFVIFNILLTAALRSLLERLLKRKRAREILMFLVVAISVLPQFLFASRMDFKGFSKYLDNQFLVIFPWRAASDLMLGQATALPLLALAVAIATAYLFARSLFERSLRFDGETGAVVRSSVPVAESRWEWVFTWPIRIFPDPIAAIVEKELRSLVRTSQFRFVFLMASAFGVILYLPMRMRGGRASLSYFSEHMLTFAAVYGVLLLGQVSYFNCFGFERSAVQAWFSFPLRLRTVLVAKNLTALCFVLVEVVLVTLTAGVFRLQVTPGKLAETFVAALICALYLIAVGNMASVRLAHPLNPERVSQGGSSKAKNAVIMAAFPILVLPLALAYWARYVFESELVFAGLLVFAAGFGGILYYFGLDSAIKMGMDRREKILTDLSRGDGPISIT